MKILSLQETDKTAREADELCGMIEKNYAELHDGRLRRQGRTVFEVLQKGRNIVYRVKSDSNWFLKIPCNGKSAVIEGEMLGFQRLAGAVSEQKQFRHAASVRISSAPGYILAAAIPGKQLNLKLYRNCLHPLGRAMEQVINYFYEFGKILAAVHGAGAQPIERETSLNALQTFENRLGRLKRSDALSRDISEWFQEFPKSEPKDAFVHGNCTLRNILVHDGRLSLIDFETCGAGVRYLDIGMLCRDLVLCQTARAFPWRRVYKALSAFLEGYQSIFPLDRTMLKRYFTLFIASHYLQVHRIKNIKESISGFPVSKSRLETIIAKLIAGREEEVLHGVCL